jgi:NADPH2:quinone reductase
MLVQVGAAGVNPVDTYIRSGTNNYKTTFPHTPGSDGAGTIVEVGKNVTEFEVGQRVYFSRNLGGSSAEFTVCAATHTYPLADALSFEEGACLGVPYTTAHRALFGRANAKAGDKVLVHGATGAVGIATVQLALAAGMDVVASAGTEAGADLLRQQGVTTVIMHNEADHLAPFQTLASGFDIVIEMLANHNLDQDLKALAFGGCVAVIGNRGTVEINPRDLMARDASVVGVALANVQPKELALIAKSLRPLFEKGVLKPVVRHSYALTELAQAHEDVLKSGALGNLVIRIGE